MRANEAGVRSLVKASKGEINKLITRIKDSSDEELRARKVELEYLIALYEDKLADTEREDLEEKYQDIVDSLETAQDALEEGHRDNCIIELTDALLV